MNDNGISELLQSRILVEKLFLKRNPLDYKAYIETFRESMIDANPHQIEAIVFALEKLENGGCILADEVGLGKTIEAGLIISQYRANRNFNILIILPTSLAGQWNSELKQLFQIPSRIITSLDKKGLKKEELRDIFKEDGTYIIGREMASRLQKDWILGKKDWDLIVVDEAHEIFGNIYRRFNSRTGEYNEDSKNSATAGNLFKLFKRTPILLLTATPIQNNILELWGLSSYILPENKNYLGRLHHFKQLFIQGGEVIQEKIPELKERINNVLVRNLRKNAQTYMKYKFTHRNCETLNFHMGSYEKALYDDISNYLERDDIYAYSSDGSIDIKDERRAGVRTLLKIAYRRALGSSFQAFKNSLQGIVRRLEKMKEEDPLDLITEIATDDPQNDEEDRVNLGFQEIEEFEIKKLPQVLKSEPIYTNAIDEEIQEVTGYIKRAENLERSSKDDVLLTYLQKVFSNPEKFYQKAVIFTTYIATQRHLKQILEKNGFDGEIILFSGSTKKEKSELEDNQEAINTWNEEVGSTMSPSEKPQGNILERTALVHYFKKYKKIFISTEAGAKGLNLQFCNVIINYDLPWNPQRIEQRIGRCHRYGQEKDVLVINCINQDNEAEKRVYELLTEKFNLFKNVLGAGDDILGTLSKAVNFESRIHDILNKFRTKDERLIYLKKFEDEIDEETKKLRDKKLANARRLLDELDPYVLKRLKNIKESLPESFSQYDKDVLDLLQFYSKHKGLSFRIIEKANEHIFFQVENKKYYIGKRDEDKIREYQHINLKDLYIQEIMEDIRETSGQIDSFLEFGYSESSEGSELLKPYLNCYGQWDLYKVHFKGFEEEERLYDIMSVQMGDKTHFLKPVEIDALKHISFSTGNGNGKNPSIEDNHATLQLKKFEKEDLVQIQAQQQPRIDKKLHNMKVELKDMEEYLKNEETDINNKLDEIDKKIKNTFDRDEGKNLINHKKKLQQDLRRTVNDLREFQTKFYDDFNNLELKMMEKRFIDTSSSRIFSIDFQIK